MYDIQHLHHICHRAFSPALTYIDTKYAPSAVSPRLQLWETAQTAAVGDTAPRAAKQPAPPCARHHAKGINNVIGPITPE